MRYADACCNCTEEYTPEHVYVYSGPCVISGKIVTVRIPAAGMYAYRQGALIQRAFPDMPAEDREFLMSGISGAEWNNVWEDDDDNQLEE